MTFVTYAEEKSHSTQSTPKTRELAGSERTRGEDAVPAESHSNRNVPSDYKSINGWGADLDPNDRPSYPKELPSDVYTARGDVKHWQTPRMKIFVSNEQAGLTPVFGESCPPRGLSGLLRSFAFQYGEATNRHWMTLMLADRVDRIESTILDALRGKPDHFLAEKAWTAGREGSDGQHPGRNGHRGAYIAAGAVVALAAVVLLTRNARSSRS